jgi:beta-lactamase regulating signal transducer with metallopeptidase domain
MSNPLFPASLAWALVWQTTLWLLLGAALSFVWARRPARAHRLLLLTLVAAVVTPLLSQTVRLQGWGLIARPVPAPTPLSADVIAYAVLPRQATDRDAPFELLVKKELAALAASPTTLPAEAFAAEAPSPAEAESEAPGPALTAGDFVEMALWGWAALAGALALRLLAALVRSWRMLAGGHPVEDGELQQALDRALARLGLRVAPALYTAGRVRSPMIWCWSKRPVLLLPPDAIGRRDVDWVAVFCHELAHWTRRDHRAYLLAELVSAVLCWHPLAWWAKRRLGLLCEQACDDWVLAGGTSPVSYAESLLHLLPQRRPVLAQAAVSSRSGLVRRLTHILAAGRKNPLVGRGWAILSTALVWGLVAGLGLAQPRPVTADEPPPAPAAQRPDPPPAPKAAEKQVCAGRVLGPDGKAIAGAQVALVFWPDPRLRQEPRVIGEVRAEADGKFRLEGQLPDASDVAAGAVLATAKGCGMVTVPWPADGKDLTIRLARERVVRGRLIDLQGQPAAGVAVHVNRLGAVQAAAADGRWLASTTDYMVMRAWMASPDDEEDEDVWVPNQLGFYRPATSLMVGGSVRLWNQAGGKALPIAFRNPPRGLTVWPGPVTTDAQGRFTLHGIPAGKGVVVQVRDPRFALQALDVTPPEKDQGAELTRVLAPPRTLEGLVTDAATGKPVPHALVRVGAPGAYGDRTFRVFLAGNAVNADWKGRRGLGNSFEGEYLALFSAVDSAYAAGGYGSDLPALEVRADDQGRFRLNLFAAGSSTLTVTGPAGDTYLRRTKTVSWPQEAKVRQRTTIPLTRGVPVRGKVTEAGSGQRVAAARVDFWAKGLKLPEGVRHPRYVMTGKDGGFRALLPPGSWHLLVNAARPDYVYQKISLDKLVEDEARQPPPDAKNRKEQFFRPDGWAALDLKTGEAAREVEVRVQRAPLLRGRVVGPDGEVVAKARMVYYPGPPAPPAGGRAWEEEYLRRLSLDLTGRVNINDVAWHAGPAPAPRPGPVELRDGTFTLTANNPEGTYRLYFLGADGKLGGTAQLQGKQAGSEPVTVRLAPCGTATARFLDAKGQPAADYRPQVQLVLAPRTKPAPKAETPQRIELLIDWIDGPNVARPRVPRTVMLKDLDPTRYGDRFRTDAEGRVTLPALIPGATYRIHELQGSLRDFRVEAGQPVDLGDLRLPPPPPAQPAPTAPDKK